MQHNFLELLLGAVLGSYILVHSFIFPLTKTCVGHLPIHVLYSLWKCSPKAIYMTHVSGTSYALFCIFVAVCQALGNSYLQSCRLTRQLPLGHQVPHSLLQPTSTHNFLVSIHHQVYMCVNPFKMYNSMTLLFTLL